MFSIWIDNNVANLNKTTKTILFASLITAMILPFSGMNYAQAKEITEQQIQELLKETYNLSVILDTLEKKGKDDSKKYPKTQEEFDDNITILNEYGYITTEQLDEDPVKYDKTIQERPDFLENESVSTMSCDTCQILFVDSGFYKNTWWIFWDWVYSGENLGELQFGLDSDTMLTTLDQNYNKIKPGTRTQLQLPGSATYLYFYTYSGSQSASESGFRATTATANAEVVVFDQLDNVKDGDMISIDYTLYGLTP